jgi:predicted nuclease of predicted toxin-antitoxin system
MTMPLRFVLDENQRGPLWRSIVRHNLLGVDRVDVVRVGDMPDLPLGASDPEILDWCERENRILVTFDKSTLAEHLAAHLNAGRHCPGVFMLRRGSRLPVLVSFLVLAAHASEAWEWADRIEYIP